MILMIAVKQLLEKDFDTGKGFLPRYIGFSLIHSDVSIVFCTMKYVFLIVKSISLYGKSCIVKYIRVFACLILDGKFSAR